MMKIVHCFLLLGFAGLFFGTPDAADVCAETGTMACGSGRCINKRDELLGYTCVCPDNRVDESCPKIDGVVTPLAVSDDDEFCDLNADICVNDGYCYEDETAINGYKCVCPGGDIAIETPCPTTTLPPTTTPNITTTTPTTTTTTTTTAAPSAAARAVWPLILPALPLVALVLAY